MYRIYGNYTNIAKADLKPHPAIKGSWIGNFDAYRL